jgi:AraC family transcriptional regulator of adaptative response/methylated-DNA-[protein]-cysteine methyltransferase
VTSAIYEAGYGSPSRAYDASIAGGIPPASYGRGGRGAAIDWATTPTGLGRVMVAATSRGLCFVQIGRDTPALLDGLRQEFPQARIESRPSGRLQPMLEAVRQLASGTPGVPQLPLDIQGTAFQWRVWRALQAIRPGETMSYGELARTIGAPAAVRAVARACATNPVALAVPCHRVVGADGAMRGYRWGTTVKARLIALERDANPRSGRR